MSATEADIAAARLDPEANDVRWEAQAHVYLVAHFNLVEAEKARNEMRVGSTKRRKANLHIKELNRIRDAEIAALHAIPHPTQARNIKVGCL